MVTIKHEQKREQRKDFHNWGLKKKKEYLHIGETDTEIYHINHLQLSSSQKVTIWTPAQIMDWKQVQQKVCKCCVSKPNLIFHLLVKVMCIYIEKSFKAMCLDKLVQCYTVNSQSRSCRKRVCLWLWWGHHCQPRTRRLCMLWRNDVKMAFPRKRHAKVAGRRDNSFLKLEGKIIHLCLLAVPEVNWLLARKVSSTELDLQPPASQVLYPVWGCDPQTCCGEFTYISQVLSRDGCCLFRGGAQQSQECISLAAGSNGRSGAGDSLPQKKMSCNA